jgi:outer membrane beta-barrel protein
LPAVHRWGTLHTCGLITALCLTAHVATADSASPPTDAAGGAAVPAKPSEAPLPSCLDETLKQQLGEQLVPRGVQKRNFIKAHKVELEAHGGVYGGDLTSASWIAGGSLGYWLTEDFGLAGEFDLTPLTLDLDAPLTKFFGDNRFKPSTAYVVVGNAEWSPIHAKLKAGGGIVHADLIVYGGIGRMFQDTVEGLSYDAGGAIELLVSKVATVRIDFRDLAAIEQVAGQTRLTNNLIAMVGIGFWIPTPL